MSSTRGRPGKLGLLSRNRLAVAGLAIVVAYALLALAAPLLALPEPTATALSERLLPPFSQDHLLGTDHLGRDLFSRLVWGARVSLAVALMATLVAAALGSAIGIIAGYYAGWIDGTLMRGIDVVMAFPYLLLALTIVAVLGPGILNALLAVAIVNIPFFARAVRGATLTQVGRDYVDAARLSGLSNLRILLVELLPNVMPTIVVMMATTTGWMVLETAGLSFLGLGTQPPDADLGSMLGEGRKLIVTAPHVATIPGIAILLLVIGINLLADGVRDALDPRLSSGELTRPAPVTLLAPELRCQPSGTAANPGREAPLLEVRGLKTWFDTAGAPIKAVDGVDFALGAGRCLGIIGESGSGKSVTGLSIAGLVPSPPGRIVAGEVRYRGNNLLRADAKTLRHLRGNRIAYVFQDAGASLDPLFTVGGQIAESLMRHQGLSHRQARQRAIELLRRVRIARAPERVHAYPHELSGGMRQRVGIALAIANEPDVLIADEPTTALDVVTQARILKLLDEIRREGETGLILISHDFAVIAELADDVVVMRDGAVVERGGTAELFRGAKVDYTRTLMASVPRLGRPERLLTPAVP